MRLSSPGWARFAARDLELVTSGDRLFEIVQEKLNTKLPTFAVRLKRFVDLYLIDARRRTREKLAGQATEFMTPDDWIYSAFLPLPHARIQIPGGQGTDFAELSVLFWTGESAVGVLMDPASSRIGSKRRNLARLQEYWPDLKLVELSTDRFKPDDERFPGDLFPPALLNFWEGLSMPQGPSLSGVLETSFVAD